jgi:hypothetical protein
MKVHSNHASHGHSFRQIVTGAAGDTTPTDPRSQRNRASRRGGQLLTRALSSSYTSACPHLRAPGASVPDGRTIRQDRQDPSRTSAPAILIPVTNPLERLNKEVKRRSDVVGIFPNEASIVRLIGAVLLEQNDAWLLQHRYMQVEAMTELTPLSIDALPTQLPPQAA